MADTPLDPFTQAVENVTGVFNAHILEIFNGKGVCTNQYFVSFCRRVANILDHFTRIDVGSEQRIHIDFLCFTLPKIVDILLRRSSRREHVSTVMDVLRNTLIVVTRRTTCTEDMTLNEKMMELRNHIICGGSTFRFVPLKDLGLLPGYSSYGFLGEHGKYESCIMNQSIVKFWPKDWKEHLGGFHGVGHFVCVFVNLREIDQKPEEEMKEMGITNEEQWVWLDGQIISYDPDTDMHSITTCIRPQLKKNVISEETKNGFVKRNFEINLSNTLHTWVDNYYREDVVAFQRESGQLNGISGKSLHHEFLSYSRRDEGKYIVMDHSVSGKRYFGKVMLYDPDSCKYKIVFDDKTSRDVHLQSLETNMNVILLVRIPSKVLDTTKNRSPGSSAKIVRTWYESLDTSTPSDVSEPPTVNITHSSPYEKTHTNRSLLPAANGGSGACYLRIELVELFLQENGCELVILGMTDNTLPPPSLRVILLHLKLLYYMRTRLKVVEVDDVIFKLKSCVHTCLSRYDEEHMKHVSKQDLSTLIRGVQDLVSVVDPKNTEIKVDMEGLHLNMALKYLQSSQLQKRYLGLSIIREHIENAVPAILDPKYVLNPRGGLPRNSTTENKRHSILGATYIEDFILKNGVYDLIFGKNFHQDLALKSDFLLVFLARRNSLTGEHLRMIWQVACEGHETVVRALYRLLLHITPVLKPKLRIQFFNIIRSTPDESYTEHYLIFLRDFTLRAIQAFKDEKITIVEPRDKEKDSSSNVSTLQSALEHLGDETDMNMSNVASADSSLDSSQKSLEARLMGKGKRMWLGFAVLWRFVQDVTSQGGNLTDGLSSSFVDENMIDVAVELLIDLLTEDNFKDEREYILLKCLYNIQLGCSIATSMKIIRLTLSLYPSPRKDFISSVKSSVKSTVTISYMIDKLNKQEYGDLVSTIFRDIGRYHDVFKQHVDTIGANENLINDARIKVNGKRSKTCHFNGLVERLQLLACVLSYSPNVTLNRPHLLLLWKVYVEDAATSRIAEAFIEWIGELLVRENKQFNNSYLTGIVQLSETVDILPSKLQQLIMGQDMENKCGFFEQYSIDSGKTSLNTAFVHGVLNDLFETKLLPLSELHTNVQGSTLLLRPQMASFSIKLFLYVNHNTIRSDGDAEDGWSRTTSQLLGVDVLWKIAIDATDDLVHEAASYLLVELHHRFSNIKSKEVDIIRGNFLKKCFSEMSRSIQCLQTVTEEGNPGTSEGHDTLLDSTITRRRVSRYVATMSSFIKRFHVLPRPYTVVHIVNRRSGLIDASTSGVETFRTSMRFPMLLSDSLGSLRDVVGSHFNVSPEAVCLTRVNGVHYNPKKSSETKSLVHCDEDCEYETLENDAQTLHTLKFKPMETFIVKRIESKDDKPSTFPPEVDVGSNHLFGKYKKEDIFEIQLLDSNFVGALNPFGWLGLRTIVSNAHNNFNFIESKCVYRDPFSLVLSSNNDDNFDVDLFALPASPLPHHDDMCILSNDGYTQSGHRLNSISFDNNSSISSVLKQYLDKKPEHFSQLLHMLDGYFSVNSSFAGVDSDHGDVSIALWEVIQSLPCHLPILRKLQKLIPVPTEPSEIETGGRQAAFFAKLLDPHSPYSMLYTLQIIDTMLHTSGEKSLGASEGMGRSQLEWGWKFIVLGGVEVLIGLLESLMKKWKYLLSGSNSSTPPITDHAMGKGRGDVDVLCIVLLLRLLHKFYLFDNEYSQWQVHPVTKPGTLHGHETLCTFVPSGMLTSYRDTSSFFENIMDAVFCIISSFNTYAAGGTDSWLSPVADVQVSTVESLIDNSIVFLFSLLKTADNCADVLHNQPAVHRFIRAVTVRPVDSRLREAGCRGLLQTATFILVHASLPEGSSTTILTRTARSSRKSLGSLHPAKSIKRPSNPIVTPVHSLEEMRSDDGDKKKKRRSSTTQPGNQLPKRLSHSSSVDSNNSEKPTSNKKDLFYAIFQLVLDSVHPSFRTPNWDASKGALESIGPERYANGEQVYSLIAGLIALQGRPDILATAKLESISPSRKSSSNSMSKEDMECSNSGVDDRRLCSLFFEKLISHQSQESVHSPEPDEMLAGILRVLLVLVYGQTDLQKFFGTLTGQLYQEDEAVSINAVSFLYSHCLFPSANTKFSHVAVCLSPTSRKLAYALLLEVCGNNSSNFTVLIDLLSVENATNSDGGYQQETSEGEDILPIVTKSLGWQLYGSNVARSVRQGNTSAKPMLQWEYDPNVLIKKQNTYLGLVNQGCTCYMNAFLQQLFHVEAFTNTFLAIESNIDNMDNADDNTKDGVAVMFELQMLFCQLKLSQKKYCDTIDLAKVFKDFDQEPIRLGEQKDINEFAAMLFDKLECNQECKSLIRNVFGGNLVWQVISTEDDCTYRSDREEPYFMLTAEVGGKTNLEDSLDLFVAGETFSGDNKIEITIEPEEPGGEFVKRKVDAIRRCAIRSLPPILLIHLKRFEFDVETMNRRKLNDYFTFPSELDMFPYTEEGLREDEVRRRSNTHGGDDSDTDVRDDEMDSEVKKNNGEKSRDDYRYALKGVVVHTGAIDAGHYYAFIRVRSPLSSTSGSEDGDWEWMEFNDTAVSPFSMDSIPAQCFGGSSTNNGQQRWKPYNAYMLVYERIHESHAESQINKTSDEEDDVLNNEVVPTEVVGNDEEESLRHLITKSVKLDRMITGAKSIKIKPRKMIPRSLSGSGVSSISSKVLTSVEKENLSFILDLMHYNEDYILFFWKLIKSKVLDDSISQIAERGSVACKTLVCRTIYITLAFCFRVLFRARGQQCIPPFLERFEDLVGSDISGFCASQLIAEFARGMVTTPGPSAGEISPVEKVPEEDGLSSTNMSVTPAVRSKAHLPLHISPELFEIEAQLHPMLTVIYIECPHTFTINGFSAFMLRCIETARHQQDYLSEDGSMTEAANVHVVPDAAKIDLGLEEDGTTSSNTMTKERLQDQEVRNPSKFSSGITRLLCKLLLIIENYQPADVIGRRNYDMMTEMIRSFVLLGEEEEVVLIRLGGIYRLICSWVVLHPVHLRMPNRDCLRSGIDTVCILMKSAKIELAADDTISSRKCITDRDVRAFTARIVLEISLNISFPDGNLASSIYSDNFLHALQNICDQFGAEDVLKFFGFFMEKMFDNLAPTLPRTKLINDQIDLSFHVLRYLIFHVVETYLRLGSVVRERTEFILDQSLAWIISKTINICRRRSPSDSDFVNQVVKLLYRVGCQSELGFQSVMRMNNHWEQFYKVYTRGLGKERLRPTQANPSQHQQQQRQQQSQQSQKMQKPHQR